MIQPLKLQPWQFSFYVGERLLAEVQLLGAGLVGDTSFRQLTVGCRLLKTSFGASEGGVTPSPFQEFHSALPNPSTPAESRYQYFSAVECPDSLLLWALDRHLPTMSKSDGDRPLLMLARTAQLLMKHFPLRPDLPHQLLLREPTGALLKGAPKGFPARRVPSNPQSFCAAMAWGKVVLNRWLGCLDPKLMVAFSLCLIIIFRV